MTDADRRPIDETVSSVLAAHPVTVGYLFGSHARGEADARSDVDVAVALEDCHPGDSGHADRLLALGVDLAVAFGTDDVDVVDIRSAAPSVRRSVFSNGVRLVGSKSDADRLRDGLRTDDTDPRSPAERFDEALAAVDEHLA
ncbi:type VII toxin-antitoxin system MntA family adenylyltransferase antitoxin [Halovivax cerinus]|uniref:Nucleotidyltransferase domain-containing protein n=1 Tax=Halovivax cerinus TaxID=1487865 RepID=A0ABD5NPS8_9EURY|nr:nucleotidyltransferase domain-containing protein [Halovivax cerinus]